MKIIDLDDLEGHWPPVRSAILATAGLFVTDKLLANVMIKTT